jgi:hypothetical protein
MEAPETSLARVHGDIYKKRKKKETQPAAQGNNNATH